MLSCSASSGEFCWHSHWKNESRAHSLPNNCRNISIPLKTAAFRRSLMDGRQLGTYNHFNFRAARHPLTIDGEDRRRCATDLMSGISAKLERLSVGARVCQSKPQRTHIAVSYCRPRSCDLFIGIAVYAKHIVVLRFRSFALGTEIGIHVLPNNITRRCNLEKASKPPVVDQRIPVRQALSVGDARTEKIRRNTLLVFPHNVVCSRIYLYDSRKRKALIQTVGAVVKNENIAVW